MANYFIWYKFSCCYEINEWNLILSNASFLLDYTRTVVGWMVAARLVVWLSSICPSAGPRLVMTWAATTKVRVSIMSTVSWLSIAGGHSQPLTDNWSIFWPSIDWPQVFQESKTAHWRSYWRLNKRHCRLSMCILTITTTINHVINKKRTSYQPEIQRLLPYMKIRE